MTCFRLIFTQLVRALRQLMQYD